MSWDNARPKLNAYGRDHQRERQRRAELHEPDDPCVRCSQPLGPMGPHLHLDHDDHDRRTYLGFAHRTCNLQAGARKARAQQIAPTGGCRYCGRTLCSADRKYCNRRCGYLGSRTTHRQLTLPFPRQLDRPSPPRQCRLCGTTYAVTGTAGRRRIYCSDECTVEYNARSLRERYRAKAGLPQTWHDPTSNTARWRGPVYDLVTKPLEASADAVTASDHPPGSTKSRSDAMFEAWWQKRRSGGSR